MIEAHVGPRTNRLHLTVVVLREPQDSRTLRAIELVGTTTTKQ
jgi:hypothetical protein